jgi:hypothetical protein
MKPQLQPFALCLENSGNEASLVLGKVYRVVPDPGAAKNNLVRIIDESGDDYLFANDQFAFVDFPRSIRRRILALEHVRQPLRARTKKRVTRTSRCRLSSGA